MKTFSKAMLIFGLTVMLFSSCKIFEMGRETERAIPLVEKDYEILGTVRVEGRTGKKDLTYDGLLQEARTKYGPNVDVIGLKIDKMQKGKIPYLIMNAYAVKYK